MDYVIQKGEAYFTMDPVTGKKSEKKIAEGDIQVNVYDVTDSAYLYEDANGTIYVVAR